MKPGSTKDGHMGIKPGATKYYLCDLARREENGVSGVRRCRYPWLDWKDEIINTNMLETTLKPYM